MSTSKSNIESIINETTQPLYNIKKLTMCIYDDTMHCVDSCPLLKCYRVNNRYKSFKVSNNVIDLTRGSNILNGINMERIIERSKSSVKIMDGSKSKPKSSKVKAPSVSGVPIEVNNDATIT